MRMIEVFAQSTAGIDVRECKIYNVEIQAMHIHASSSNAFGTYFAKVHPKTENLLQEAQCYAAKSLC